MLLSGKITINQPQYPDLLQRIYNPPKQLYYQGDPHYLTKTAISIIGTRKCSDYGIEITRKIIADLANHDIVIVSGMALGIDSVAHQAALDYGLGTIAVLGSGLDIIYPQSNRNLAQKISAQGLILSEYPPSTPPKDFHFPQRNRIVSGLSIATIVVEAPERSGTLITARLALNQGREIFVVPGDVYRQNSLGVLKLLQTGAAYPISSGKEVMEILKQQPHLFQQKAPEIKTNQTKTTLHLAELEQQIYNSLKKRRPRTLEQISSKLDLSINQILETLSDLEIRGLIKNKSGQYYRL